MHLLRISTKYFILATIVTVEFLYGGIYDLNTSGHDPFSNFEKNDDGYLVVPFSALTQFDYELKQRENALGEYEFYSDTVIPDSVLNLQGVPIEISGYMLPVDLNDDGAITLFFLLASLQTCCFGDNINYNEWIVVNVPDGTNVFELDNLVTIRGAIEVRAEFEDGIFNGMYHTTTSEVFIK